MSAWSLTVTIALYIEAEVARCVYTSGTSKPPPTFVQQAAKALKPAGVSSGFFSSLFSWIPWKYQRAFVHVSKWQAPLAVLLFLFLPFFFTFHYLCWRKEREELKKRRNITILTFFLLLRTAVSLRRVPFFLRFFRAFFAFFVFCIFFPSFYAFFYSFSAFFVLFVH